MGLFLQSILLLITFILVVIVPLVESLTLKEKKQLVRFVNESGRRKEGSCGCNNLTFRCHCLINSPNGRTTNYKLGVEEASRVVEEMLSESVSEKRRWPPTASFQFQDKRLGRLSGTEEPLAHLQIFPWKESDVNAKFLLFYPSLGSNLRPIQMQNTELKLNASQAIITLPTIRLPLLKNNRIEGSDVVSVCQRLVLVVHGFRGSTEDQQFIDMRNALSSFHEFLTPSRACILMIDWRDGAAAGVGSSYYAQAAANTLTVGRMTGLLIHLLVQGRQIRPQDVHIIGFSLGAHVAHFASNWYQHLDSVQRQVVQQENRQPEDQLQQQVYQPIGRITGLDPAARHFQGYESAVLTKGDASFVDIIHSSNVLYAGNYMDVLHSRYGNPDATADVDFYPNGGDAPQPGCSGRGSSCSHNRAIDYFIDSLNASLSRDPRLAVPCDNYLHFDQCFNMLFASNARLSSQKTTSAKQRISSEDKKASVSRPVDLDVSPGRISYMGYEAPVFPGRGKLFLNYTATHVGVFVQ